MMYLFDILHVIFPGIAIAAWATVFTRLQDPGEAFAWIPEAVVRAVTFGKRGAKEKFNPNLFQTVIFKWATCGKCHAGIVAVVVTMISLQDFSQITPYFLRELWLMFTSSVFFAIFFERI